MYKAYYSSPTNEMPEIIDDKSEHCVPFILDRITKHRESFASKGEEPTPFFVGLNGVQGAGKTTLVRTVPLKHLCDAENVFVPLCITRSRCREYACSHKFIPRSAAETKVGHHSLQDPLFGTVQPAYSGLLDRRPLSSTRRTGGTCQITAQQPTRAASWPTFDTRCKARYRDICSYHEPRAQHPGPFL